MDVVAKGRAAAGRTRQAARMLSGRAAADRFVTAAPNPANMVAAFPDGWASELPIPGVVSGGSGLFDDQRISWFLEQVGGAAGRRILELGPLEGGHTYMLDRAGAAQVVAVEANTDAWLKCLAVKETLGMPSARFLLGDFMAYLSMATGSPAGTPPPRDFDLALACGVLYHLRDPHLLFPLLRASCAGPVLLWTMIWSPAIPHSHPQLARNFTAERTVELATGVTVKLHQHDYRRTRGSARFWGGVATYSEWLSREDLLLAVTVAGYEVAEVAFDEPDHPNGPSLGLLLKPNTP